MIKTSAIPKWAKITFAVVLAVGAGVVVSRTAVSAFRPHLYAGTVLQGGTPAPPMDGIHLASGEEVDMNSWGGDVVLVYFGYTHCPDVCPTTLSTAAQAITDLSDKNQERTQLLMVSVDPARDTSDSLQEYVEFFDPDFLGATGDVSDIDRVASQYGVFYELGEGTIDEGYTVDHTATLMGIGPDGELRIVWPPDATADQMSSDIKELLS